MLVLGIIPLPILQSLMLLPCTNQRFVLDCTVIKIDSPFKLLGVSPKVCVYVNIANNVIGNPHKIEHDNFHSLISLTTSLNPLPSYAIYWQNIICAFAWNSVNLDQLPFQQWSIISIYTPQWKIQLIQRHTNSVHSVRCYLCCPSK